MADVSGVELERLKKRREFYSELEQYYRRKWNTSLRIPYVSGRPVDFYALYQKVTTLGGWAKVSSWNRWHDVVESLNIPTGCAASEHAVKSIYMRYLAKFEQSQLFGETDGDNGDGPVSSLSGRSQRGRLYLSSLGGQAVASPRYASSILPDCIQSSVPTSSVNGVLDGPHCERLIRSLESGLPNEVDFAVNVCTILSSAATAGSRHISLRLNETPSLLDLLLAHAGIFDHGSRYRALYNDSWKSYNPERSFEAFWLNCIEGDDNLVNLLLGTPLIEDGDRTSLSMVEDLFCCLNLPPIEQATMAKRVDQIANILRNFSFESDCRSALASSRTMIRYLLIAINCRNIGIQSLALDTLSNIASEMVLDEIDPSLLRLLMDMLSHCLHSDDKFHVIRALETIGNLCSNERNEILLCEYLEPVVIRRMIALLAVKDIMMCVYLLECLYQMTEMGPVPCQRIAEQPKAVDTLIQLVTVEAVSFGPNGLLGMKVVEYGMPAPHTAILSHPSKAAPVLPVRRAVGSTDGLASMHSAVRPVRPVVEPAPAQVPATSSTAMQQAPPPFLARPVRPVTFYGASSNSPLASASHSTATGPGLAVRQQTPPTSPMKKETVAKVKSDGPAQISPAPVSAAAVISQQPNSGHRAPTVATHQDQHVEQLTMNWLRQNCSVDPGSHVSRGELYASYVQDMSLHGSTAVLVTVFTNYVRQIFPSCTVRQLDIATNGGSDATAQTPNCRSTLLQFDGLKFRPKTAVRNILISPSSSCSSSSPPLSQVAAQHPLMQQILSAGNSPEKSNSGLSNASPVSVRTPASTGGIPANVIRARSNSAGTLDSGYSLPGTPDSLSSGFSGTNSSTGFGGATSFTSGQQQANSPKSPRKAAKVGGKKATKDRSSTPASTANVGVNNDNGLVNGSMSNMEPISSTTASGVCHLEVCHPAQEARTVIETGDSHEARIVRVENTIALVSSQFYIPDGSSSSLPSPLPPVQKPVNGVVGGESSSHSDNSNGCEPSSNPSVTMAASMETGPTSTTTATTTTTAVTKQAKKKAAKKKAVDETAPPLLNGLIKPLPGAEAGANSTVSTGSSPSPDVEAINQNVNQSVQDITVLLAGRSNDVKVEKLESTAEVVPPAATLVKKTPKKGNAAKKRKAMESANEGAPVNEEPVSEKPPPKKKRYPKKKKVTEATASPQKSLDDSFSQASTSSAHSSSGAAPTSTSAAFRLPLPPTGSQSPQVIQPTVITGTGANGQQVIVRIPPPGRLQYVCEWNGCGRSFVSANAVYFHVAKSHIDDETRVCHWPHCDQTVRLRWSLVAHVQDVHCSEHALRAAAVRRYEMSFCGHSNVPEARTPPPHPGYPADAAIVAIRRHSLVNLAKEIVDETEGPVTKSIRLTSSLILRNLARYSADGRRILRKHERILTYLAFSRLESSAALAQCLAELNYSSAPFKRVGGGDSDSSI